LRRDQVKTTGQERSLLAKRLDIEERLLKEVSGFRSEAERVANLGWEPDLDDGIILCSTPLSKLFPAWRAVGREDAKNPGDPEQARRMINEGKFAWATISKWAGKL
jgi:hypothetical protein